MDFSETIWLIWSTQSPDEDIRLLKVKVIFCPFFKVTEIILPVNISNISPMKPVGGLTPNFIWSLSRMGEWKFVRVIWITWPRWPPCPYMVKTLQKSSSPEPKGLWPWNLVCNIGHSGPSFLVRMMIVSWPWPILRQGQLWCVMLLYGKIQTVDFSETIEV